MSFRTSDVLTDLLSVLLFAASIHGAHLLFLIGSNPSPMFQLVIAVFRNLFFEAFAHTYVSSGVFSHFNDC